MPKPPEKTYLGIDPGKQGGIVALKGTKIEWYLMPDTEIDLLTLLESYADASYCCLENVGSRPGEGHKGAFTFGEGFGRLKMGVLAVKVPFELVQPRTWQKLFKVKPKGSKETHRAFKDRIRQIAQRQFPRIPLWYEKGSLGKQRAMCDALLIAEYCRKLREGTLNA